MIGTGSHSEMLRFHSVLFLLPPSLSWSSLLSSHLSSQYTFNSHTPYFLYQRSTQVSLWFKKRENFLTNFNCPNDKRSFSLTWHLRPFGSLTLSVSSLQIHHSLLYITYALHVTYIVKLVFITTTPSSRSSSLSFPLVKSYFA